MAKYRHLLKCVEDTLALSILEVIDTLKSGQDPANLAILTVGFALAFVLSLLLLLSLLRSIVTGLLS